MILLSAFVGAFCAASVTAQAVGSTGPASIPGVPAAVGQALSQLQTDIVSMKTSGQMNATIIYNDALAIVTASIAALKSGTQSAQVQGQVTQLTQVQTQITALKTAGTPPSPQQIGDLIALIVGSFMPANLQQFAGGMPPFPGMSGAPPADASADSTTAAPKKKKKPIQLG